MDWRFLTLLLLAFASVHCLQLRKDSTDPPFPPVCTNCLDGIRAFKNTIEKVANFAKITIGTMIDKICNHFVPEYDILEAICHVIDQNVEVKVYQFLMAIHDKINESFICHVLSFCPK